jgi:ferredoxin
VTTQSITREGLAALVAALSAQGTEVIAPARAADGKVDYRAITTFAEAVLEGDLPRRSLKECFLPASEPLFSWKREHGGITLTPAPTTFAPRVILGARPCDAAGVEALDKVMGWDYRDDFWFGRREATTIITLACPGVDGSCFCRAVGLSPEAEQGADILLIPLGEGWLVRPVTEKGALLLQTHANWFTAMAEGAEAEARLSSDEVGRGGLPAVVDLQEVSNWLSSHFEHEVWEDLALRCHGCGACASVCPTCHCFDIVDEPEGIDQGVRRRNWDTCQTGLFTLHASGHNPRGQQNARFRQRLLHKFHVYPHKFGVTLCTGCGRCARACPGGMDLPEMLGRVTALAEADGGKEIGG